MKIYVLAVVLDILTTVVILEMTTHGMLPLDCAILAAQCGQNTFHSFCLSANTLVTHSFNGLFFRTTWVNRHQKGRTILDLMKQEMLGGSGISWTICKSFAPHFRQITKPAPHYSYFFTGQMHFLMPNQQCQSTEGAKC